MFFTWLGIAVPALVLIYLEQNWFTLYSLNKGRRQNLLTTACNFLSLLFTEEHLAFLCLAQIIRMHCRGMRSLLRLNCAPLLSFFCPSTQQNEARSKEKTRKLGKNFKETFILMSPSLMWQSSVELVITSKLSKVLSVVCEALNFVAKKIS